MRIETDTCHMVLLSTLTYPWWKLVLLLDFSVTCVKVSVLLEASLSWGFLSHIS